MYFCDLLPEKLDAQSTGFVTKTIPVFATFTR
jgi:hypothetical protein